MIGCIAPQPASAGLLFPPAGQMCMRPDVEDRTSFSRSVGSGDITALIEAVANGDREAFAQLYERTSAKLYGICLHLLGNAAEAEEALQDIYVTVWNKADRFEAAKASGITWLSVLARNKAIDRLRRRPASTDTLDAAQDVEDESPSAFDLIGQDEDAERLGRCLDELEERGRMMIRAAFLEGATYPDLARRENVPLGTMKSWIRRGLQRLRGCLER